MTITLGDKLALPDAAVTQSFALLGMKGSGKSNGAVVFAEALYDAGIPWVAIDPKGDWWGVRANRRGGERGGLSVPIFGGLHADVPIDEYAGVVVADLIVGEHLTCVIDTSEFSKRASVKFLDAFFDRLFRAKARQTFPMHVFLEECDDYVPQRVYADVAKLVRTVELLVKRGRTRGLGITLVSQRSASINKDVLSQTDTLIALRATDPRDRKAIGEWLTYHAGAREIVDELPTLPDGTAWVSSPAELRILERVKLHRRRTFDSGATPELGESVKAATLADIDVDAVTKALKAQIEKAKEDDPAHLRAELARVRAEMARLERERPTAEVREVERIVEVEVVPKRLYEALAQASARLADAASGAVSTLDDAVELVKNMPRSNAVMAAQSERPRPAKRATRRGDTAISAAERRSKPVANAPQTQLDAKLGKRERAVLTVLAQYPSGRSRRQLAILTGYSPRTSTLGVAISTCRSAGYIADDALVITAKGLAALGDSWEPLPAGPALLEYWRGQLGKRERDTLQVLLDAYPDGRTRAELAAATGYSLQTSTLGVALSKLHGVELVERTGSLERVSDDFMEAIGGAS